MFNSVALFSKFAEGKLYMFEARPSSNYYSDISYRGLLSSLVTQFFFEICLPQY